MQIEILNSANELNVPQQGSSVESVVHHDQMLLKLHVMIMESVVQCDLVMGQKQLAIKKVCIKCVFFVGSHDVDRLLPKSVIFLPFTLI